MIRVRNPAAGVIILIAMFWTGSSQKNSPPTISWNPNVNGTATVRTFSEIFDGKTLDGKQFEKLVTSPSNPKQKTDNCACCPAGLWKRALPAEWLMNQPTRQANPFVQVNNLLVCGVEAGQDVCRINSHGLCTECKPPNAPNCLTPEVEQFIQPFYDTHLYVVEFNPEVDEPQPEFVVEIDRCWCANHFIDCDKLQLPKIGDVIDVQGFVTWDEAHSCKTPDWFSQWEIHPMSALKILNHTEKLASCREKPNPCS
jgi:hypothetical protein